MVCWLFYSMTVLLGNQTLVSSTLQGCDMETCRANIIVFARDLVHWVQTLAKILLRVRWIWILGFT